MLVSKKFDGDDINFQWLQHDCYSEALGIILKGCRSHYLAFLENHPDNEISPTLKKLDSCDHRVLQELHDHLAAYWRKQFLNKKISKEENRKAWLSWLSKAVTEFKHYTQLYVGICFLGLERYDEGQKNRVIKSISLSVQRMYPLNYRDYIKRVSMEDSLNVFYILNLFILAMVGFYSGILHYKNMPSLTLVIGLLIAAGYTYVNNKSLHELCMKNVFLFLSRVVLILMYSFAAALLIAGLQNFEYRIILSNLPILLCFVFFVMGLFLIKQLYSKEQVAAALDQSKGSKGAKSCERTRHN